MRYVKRPRQVPARGDLHRQPRGLWHWQGAGSDFRNGNGGCSLTGKLPKKVISDLDLC
jgi:hypothetical protein